MKYTVEIVRKVDQYYTVEVEAANEEDAGDLAWAQVISGEAIPYEKVRDSQVDVAEAD